MSDSYIENEFKSIDDATDIKGVVTKYLNCFDYDDRGVIEEMENKVAAIINVLIIFSELLTPVHQHILAKSLGWGKFSEDDTLEKMFK